MPGLQDLLILAGSAAMVGVIVVIVWLSGFRQTAVIDCGPVLENILKSFAPDTDMRQCAVDAKGRFALAELSDGRIAAAVSMGADVTVRFFQPSVVRVRLSKGQAIVRFADVGFPPLKIAYPNNQPPELLRKFAGRRKGGAPSPPPPR